MLKFLWLCLLWFPTLVHASHCRNSISGIVTDSETGEALPFANIFILELKDGVVADLEGRFYIGDLCEGNFTLQITHVGCTPVTRKIKVDEQEEIQIKLDHSLHVLKDVQVIGEQQTKAAGIGNSQIKGDQLQQNSNLSIGNALAQVNGVTVLATGNNVQKPAIHGLTGNRVGIYNNGVKLESQMWGSEHAPEVGLYGAEKINIYKGVSALKYGGDALAGIIQVSAPDAPKNKGLVLGLSSAYSSNYKGLSNGINGIFNTGGRLKIDGHFAAHVIQNGNYQSPSRVLTNTGAQTENLKLGLGRSFSKSRLEFFYANYRSNLGVLDGAHIGNLTDLRRVLEAGEAISGDTFTYAIAKPKQAVFHETTGILWSCDVSTTKKLSLRLNRQYNQRQEFDKHGAKGLNAPKDIPALQLELTTWSGEAAFRSTQSNWQYEIGVQGNRQKNTYEGSYFVPGFYRNQLGGYGLYSRRLQANTSIELGGRIDYAALEAFNVRSINRSDTILAYATPSFHLQLNRNWSNLKTSFQSGIAWRPPAVNELFAQGLHHASARVETGSVSLDAERAINNALELEFTFANKLTASALIYANYYFNFIYLEPQPNAVLTIRGAFPEFNYKQTQAWHRGADINLSYQFSPKWSANASAATVFLSAAKTGNFLPNMPADRFQLKLAHQPNENKMGVTNLWMACQFVGQQNRLPTFSGNDNESNSYFAILTAPTASYQLVSAGISGTKKVNRNIHFSYFISGTNLLNKTYRDYTNAFRFYAAEMARNITIGLSLKFNS